MRLGQSLSTSSRGGLHDEVMRHLNYMFDVVLEGRMRPRSLRSSGLPYCPVLDVLLPKEADQTDLSSALYTSMGTAAHLALQAFATQGPLGRRVWGGWKCPRCNHQWRQMQFRPDRCPTGCNDAPIYEEVSYRLGITGHSDLVVQYPSGAWVVHEYKTIGRKPREPKPQHILQARTYCHMLRQQYGISASYVIIYLGRTHLERWTFGPYSSQGSSSQLISDWTTRSVVGFRAASAARRRATPENLLEVARCRPCTDRESYDAYMARRMGFDRKTCPMLGTCSRTDRDVARHMMQTLDT